MILPAQALAAISFVGSCENSAASNPNGADVTLTLPSMQLDDLVIVAYSNGDADDVDENVGMITAGYTEVADLFANDTNETNFGVYWKVMGASPDTSATVDGLGGIDTSVAAVCMVFRGVSTTTPMDISLVGGTTLNTMHANPGPIDHNNPSGVWTVIAGASGHTLAGAGTYTFPTGYTTNAVDRGSDDTSDTTVGLGYRSSGVSDPEDPGTMTHSGTDNAAFASATTTMALRPAVVPTVTTQDASSIGATSATFNGTITATGGATVTRRGFAWGTSATMVDDTATTTEDGTFDPGAFTDSAQTLNCATTYYYRPYAVNIAGTSTAPISNSFNTSACATPPTVNTNFANPGATTATLYGTKTGGEDATQHGFAWGTNAALSGGDTATTTLGALGGNSSFTSGIGGLSASLTYYFRAYVTGATGTGYGAVKSFVTGDTNVTRKMRLFEGFTVKLRSGRIILY